MNFRHALISSTIAISCLAAAAYADAAKADDASNPYLPKPAASTETADHGQGTYCRIGMTIPGWTCDQELSTGGGTGTSTARQDSAKGHDPRCGGHEGGGWGGKGEGGGWSKGPGGPQGGFRQS